MTEKLFVKNVYLKEADLVLTQLEEINGKVRAAFESTIFFPTGGGQLCDGGTIAGYNILDVREEKESGIIWHALDIDAAEAYRSLNIGSSFKAVLDWNRRFSHMQMHCGEHLLSGAFLRLFGGANKGFHMGEDYVTIDIELPAGEMTWEMARSAEALANSYIQQNIPVETRLFDTAAEAMSLPCRKEIKFGENISVVLIGSAENPADCCACCGTHPAATGEIGLVKITHFEKYKGMSRFYVKCGGKALEDYSILQDVTEVLGRHYSCEPASLENAVKAEEKRHDELYRKYTVLKEHCIKEAESQIKNKLSEGRSFNYFEYDFLDADDLQQIARKLDIKLLTVMVSTREKCLILASDGTFNCGQYIKNHGESFRCRGGGKNNIARAVFGNESDIKAFADALEAL